MTWKKQKQKGTTFDVQSIAIANPLYIDLIQQCLNCLLLAVGCGCSCWLLAAGCWLLAAGCWLLAAGCWMLTVVCWLLAAGCWLLAAGC